MGHPSACQALREGLSSGADKAILLSDPAFDGADSHSTAVVLAEAIKNIPYDLILCGVRAIDTNSGQVGSLIASLLDIPMVTAVTDIEVLPGRKALAAQRKLEGGNREVIETSLPALLTIEAGINTPRYASLPALIAAQRKTIEIFNRIDLGLPPEQVGSRGAVIQKLALSIPKPRPKKLFTPDSNLPAAERMRLIMSGGIAARKTDILQGSPQEIAANLLKYLKQEKIIQ
jgi:electron transfer flavoprotein beta subunit